MVRTTSATDPIAPDPVVTLLGRADWFAIGMILAVIVVARERGLTPPFLSLGQKPGRTLMAALGLTVASALVPVHHEEIRDQFDTAAGAALLAGAVLHGPVLRGPQRWLASRPAQAIGRWSYGIFLWGYVVQKLITSAGGDGVSPPDEIGPAAAQSRTLKCTLIESESLRPVASATVKATVAGEFRIGVDDSAGGSVAQSRVPDEARFTALAASPAPDVARPRPRRASAPASGRNQARRLTAGNYGAPPIALPCVRRRWAGGVLKRFAGGHTTAQCQRFKEAMMRSKSESLVGPIRVRP